MIPKHKWGDCTQCPAKDVPCVKQKKDLICLSCNKRNKGRTQIQKANEKSKIRGLISSPANKSMIQKSEVRSELLKLADSLFSKYIRDRDKDREGFVTCVCCGGRFHVDDKDAGGSKIVQCLHFVPRTVYNQRFSEINCSSGCGFCNKEMHDHPTGLAYRQYKAFLERTVGREEVKAMEDSKRSINNISHADIQAVIDKYKTK